MPDRIWGFSLFKATIMFTKHLFIVLRVLTWCPNLGPLEAIVRSLGHCVSLSTYIQRETRQERITL